MPEDGPRPRRIRREYEEGGEEREERMELCRMWEGGWRRELEEGRCERRVVRGREVLEGERSRGGIAMWRLSRKSATKGGRGAGERRD